MKNIKKICVITLSLIASISIIGCSKEKATFSEVLNQNIKNGSPSIVLSTPYSNSEESEVVHIYEDNRITTLQLELDVYNFDDSKASYIYVDGKLKEKDIFGSMTTTTVTLEEKDLKVGKHKIDVVQFDNDDVSGNSITKQSVIYEVKAKKDKL